MTKAEQAILLLVQEPLGDFAYNIREHELKGWDGPRVKNWGEGARLAEEVARELGWDGRYAFQGPKAEEGF